MINHVTGQPPVFTGQINELRKVYPVRVDTFANSALKKNNKEEKTITFTGLTKLLGSKLYETAEEIKQVVDKHSNSRSQVGSFPASWIEQIPQKDRSQLINNINDAFDQASLIIKANYYDGFTEMYNQHNFKHLGPKIKPENPESEFEKAAKIIKDSFVKAGIVEETDHIELKYEGSGQYGVAFSFEVNNEKFALKVYRASTESGKYHGNYIELNRAMYIDKQSHNKDNQYAKFYFGNINSGFMVTEFVDNNSCIEKRLDEKELGIESGDLKQGENVINGKIIDYGGIEITSKNLATSKTARKVYKKIFVNQPENKHLASWKNLYEQAKENHVPNCGDIIYSLACNFNCLKDTQERLQAFNIMSSEVSDRIQHVLINQIYCLPINKHKDAVLLLARIGTPAIKESILSEIYRNRHEERLELFKAICENATPEIQKMLVSKIGYLPEKQQAEGFIEVWKIASPEKCKEFAAEIRKFKPETREALKKYLEVYSI